MRKVINLLILLITVFSLSTLHAAQTMKMRLNISNAGNHFICLYGTGCLRIIPGVSYPILHRVHFQNIFILDRRTMRVTPQAASASCNVTIRRGHTITISGSLNRSGRIMGLHCSVQ